MFTGKQVARFNYLQSLSDGMAEMFNSTLHFFQTLKRCLECPRFWRRAKNILLISVLLLGGSGCDYIYFEYTRCGYYDDPRFDRAALIQPVLNQVYADQLRVVFDNNWHRENIDYRLEVSGRLPPGITYYQSNGRVAFEGTATDLGTYSFTAIVIASYRIHDRHYSDHHAGLCSYRTTQNYQWVVAPV